MKKEKALLDGKIGKTYISYLIPTIIGMLTNSVYCIVDVMFVGIYVGSEGLAALNIAMPIFTFYSSIGLMLGIGGATTISVLIGQGDKQNVDKVFSFTIFLSAAIGLLVTILGIIFLEPFAIMMGATPELLQGVKYYTFPLQCTALFYILNCTMQVIIRADYNPKLVMTAAVVANGLNIFFDWLFVGVYGWGLTGAAAATAIGPVVAIVILSFHYTLKKNTMHFKLHCLDKNLIKRVFQNGIGTFILEFSSGAVIFMFNFVLLRVSGQAAVAVYAIISNIAYVGKGIFNGISQAAQPLISVNYGAANYNRVKKSMLITAVTGFLFAGLTSLAIFLFPAQIVGIFIGDDIALLPIGVNAAKIYFISFVFTGINTVLMYYFQSVENMKVASLIAILRGFILIAVGLLIFPIFFGEAGVWITITFAEVVTLLIALPIKKKQDSYMHQKFNLANQKNSAHQ
ncbi:MAG: MATE family efflux transporter [Oscillospiraceae bacterium]